MTFLAIVEDDPEMGEYFEAVLKQGGFETELYPTPGRFFDALSRRRPNLVVLDMQLPGMDGREVIRVLRANPETRAMLIVGVSGRLRATSDVITGLQLGADEYFAKPVDADLLLARIQTLLRRGRPDAPIEETLRYGPLEVRPESRQVKLDGQDVELTRLEFDLLLYLLRNTNRVLTRSIILQNVWNHDPSMDTRTVDKHVEVLRRKLGKFGKLIETVMRVGYVLRPPEGLKS